MNIRATGTISGRPACVKWTNLRFDTGTLRCGFGVGGLTLGRVAVFLDCGVDPELRLVLEYFVAPFDAGSDGTGARVGAADLFFRMGGGAAAMLDPSNISNGFIATGALDAPLSLLSEDDGFFDLLLVDEALEFDFFDRFAAGAAPALPLPLL